MKLIKSCLLIFIMLGFSSAYAVTSTTTTMCPQTITCNFDNGSTTCENIGNNWKVVSDVKLKMNSVGGKFINTSVPAKGGTATCTYLMSLVVASTSPIYLKLNSTMSLKADTSSQNWKLKNNNYKCSTTSSSDCLFIEN